MKRLLRFFFPWVCAACRKALPGDDDEGFCGLCWLHLPRMTGFTCQRCGVPLPEGGAFCFACRPRARSLRVRAAGLYKGSLRAGILRMKYSGRRTMVGCFGLLLDQVWRQSREWDTFDALVPVPLHRLRQKARGFNQSELLAQELSRRCGKPVYSLLERLRPTLAQAELDREHRLVNVRGAFRVTDKAELKGKRLILIDDVCTTTSTLGECARILKKRGARQVEALVLARDEVPSSD